jgi:hypothetical protein
MNPTKKVISSTKNFVNRHKTPIVIVATAVTTVVVMTRLHKGALDSVQTFLDENDLMDKYTEFLIKDL